MDLFLLYMRPRIVPALSLHWQKGAPTRPGAQVSALNTCECPGSSARPCLPRPASSGGLYPGAAPACSSPKLGNAQRRSTSAGFTDVPCLLGGGHPRIRSIWGLHGTLTPHYLNARMIKEHRQTGGRGCERSEGGQEGTDVSRPARHPSGAAMVYPRDVRSHS